MKKALLIVGVVGCVLSMCVVGASFGLHLMNPRNINLEEAMFGIVPGMICCSLFFVVAVVGLLMMLLMKNPDEAEDDSPRRKKRRVDDEEDNGDEDV